MEELRYQVDLLNAMNQRMQADDRMYRLVCATSRAALLYVDIQKGNVKMLGDWEELFPGIIIKNPSDVSKFYTIFEDQGILALRELLYLENTKKEREQKTFKKANAQKFIECRVDVIYEDNKPTDKIIRFSDVTTRKTQNDELLYMAYYDMLTGLYNRNYFVSQLANMIHDAEIENVPISIMFIDLDNFHSINDGLGLVIGDEVVQQFGFLLNEFKSDHVIISHFNADIYCLAIYNPDADHNVDVIHKALKEKTKNPFRMSNGDEVTISFTTGVAEYPEAATNTLDLINCSEIVMFRAKKKGRGEIQYFDASILQDFLNNTSIENKLKVAVFNERFSVNFQPQYYSKSNKLRGVEALIRWKDEDGTMIPPSLFIPIAEKNGTIIPIGNWVLEASMCKFSQWKKRFNTDMKLSINISTVQYRSVSFVDDVLSLIRKYELEPSNIELEITESVFIGDFKEVFDKLMVLRDYGVKISLDDFGTGYSSLSYLKKLPIDTLKIDKSFVDTIVSDENTRIILETIVFMSKKLCLETIAEGVETVNQYDFIKNIGCDCIQGYYLSKPLDEKGIERILLEGIY